MQHSRHKNRPTSETSQTCCPAVHGPHMVAIYLPALPRGSMSVLSYFRLLGIPVLHSSLWDGRQTLLHKRAQNRWNEESGRLHWRRGSQGGERDSCCPNMETICTITRTLLEHFFIEAILLTAALRTWAPGLRCQSCL